MHPKQERDVRLDIATSVGFAFAFFLGYWGWSLVRERPNSVESADSVAHLAPHFLGRVYLSLQLFVLHPQGLPAHDPWQLDVARFAAPLLLALATIYFLTSAFRARTRHELVVCSGRHEIVCGAGVHGRALADILLRSHAPVVLIDIDPQAPGLQGTVHRKESRLIADTVNRDNLTHARVARARRLIAVAGDDVVNAQIASTVRDLCREQKWKRKPVVLVQVEDRVLARFLEDGNAHSGLARGEGPPAAVAGEAKRGEGLDVRTFGANTLAAIALFGGGAANPTVDVEDAVLADLEETVGGHLLLAGDHGTLEAIVITALRRVRARRLDEPDPGSARRPLRITLIGDCAQSRRDAMARRWQISDTLIDLKATDVDPRTESAVLSRPAWSEWRAEVSHAIVACEDEHASISIAVTLSRVLAPGVRLARVVTQPKNDLDRQLAEQRDSRRARIDVISITDLAWGRNAERVPDVPPAGRLAVTLVKEGLEQQAADEVAKELVGDAELGLHSDPVPRITPATAPIVDALLKEASGEHRPAVTSRVLVLASLFPELASRANLARAAARLTREGSPHAFSAWCEYARLVPVDTAAAAELPDTAAAAALREMSSGGGVPSAPLRLKAAAMGSGDVLDDLAPDRGAVAELETRASRRIVIFAGGAASMTGEAREEITKLLVDALRGYDGAILTGGNETGVCGAVRMAARVRNVPVIGYAPAGRGKEGTRLRFTAPGDFSASEPVAMWTDILAAARARGALSGAPADVRLVAFPGGSITRLEIVLARALGAAVASLDPREQLEEPLEELLPFDAGGVLALPSDAMTLRAFLMCPNESLEPDRRRAAARELHDQYRREHRRHKPSDDPALVPWERLSSVLRQSNLAAVDDIPNKLHVVGRRLVVGGERLVLSDAEVELLAEMEHGRFNCERLSSGWELGRTRALSHLVSPYLLGWDELEEKVKQWDRDAVLALDGALRAAGWGVEPEETATVRGAGRIEPALSPRPCRTRG